MATRVMERNKFIKMLREQNSMDDEDSGLSEVASNSPGAWKEREHPSNGNIWYRAVESDEFPVGTYIKQKTGRGITHFFRIGHSHGSENRCHYPSDADALTKEFSFKKIHVFDTYDNDDNLLISRNLYELETESGIVLLWVSGYPTSTGKSKPNPKARIHISIISNAEEDIYNEIRNRLVNTLRKPKLPTNNVHLVINSAHGYDTEQFDLPKQNIDIELNYGKTFEPVHKKIIESLNKQKSKGLVLLHGDPGTGKTHYLKYIASKVKDKKVLFIPPFLADFITSPEMTPFLIDNSNSVLFIEDAERVITDRSESGSNGVSNILNITDGILSDILNIQIVATFNMDRQKIDPALLRKGRLIAEHKFEALSVEDSNKLLKHLGIEHTATKPMTLTEIYNFKESHYTSEETVGKRTIGFGSR
jgi:SpoVK/Ycf46/Vps4 family AAA+-type ATPase